MSKKDNTTLSVLPKASEGVKAALAAIGGDINVGQVNADDLVEVFVSSSEAKLEELYTKLQKGVKASNDAVSKKSEALNKQILERSKECFENDFLALLEGVVNTPLIELGLPTRRAEKAAFDEAKKGWEGNAISYPDLSRKAILVTVAPEHVSPMPTDVLKEAIRGKKDLIKVKLQVRFGLFFSTNAHEDVSVGWRHELSFNAEMDIAEFRDLRQEIADQLAHGKKLKTQLAETQQAIVQLPRIRKELRGSLARARIEAVGEEGEAVLEYLNQTISESHRFNLAALTEGADEVLNS